MPPVRLWVLWHALTLSLEEYAIPTERELAHIAADLQKRKHEIDDKLIAASHEFAKQTGANEEARREFVKMMK